MTGQDETRAIAMDATVAIGRPPVSFDYVDGRSVIVWEPPLTAQEQAVVSAIAEFYGRG